jgi:hypothetical protein
MNLFVCRAKICRGAICIAHTTVLMLLKQNQCPRVTQNGRNNERGVPSTVCSMSKNRKGDPMIKYHILVDSSSRPIEQWRSIPNLCDRGNRCHRRRHTNITICRLLRAITRDYTQLVLGRLFCTINLLCPFSPHP